MANSILKKRPISLAEQVSYMKLFFPEFKVRWHKNIVNWIGKIQPSDINQIYRIKIVHQLNKSPRVYVLSPSLVPDGNGQIPHTYPGASLCLYHPRKQEWCPQMHVATTIIPWTSLWLFYYEVWQATGEWLGGGEHPQRRRKKYSPLHIAKRLRI